MNMCKCSSCKAWHHDSAKSLGQCRLNPPMANLVMGRDMAGQPVAQVFSYYPETEADHQCAQGETVNIGPPAASLGLEGASPWKDIQKGSDKVA